MAATTNCAADRRGHARNAKLGKLGGCSPVVVAQ